jgi:putative thioredoxin
LPEQANILELSEQSFGASAVLNSHKLPVLVEFMGVWSRPCIAMADRLVALAREFAGQFIFAKVDVDEQQALREQYQIAHVPTLLVFRDGGLVRTEVGELGEDELRALLREFGVFRESDELCEQARARHIEGDSHNALLLLTEAIQKDPGNTRVALDRVQILLDIGELAQAKELFGRLPEATRQSSMGKAVGGHLLFSELAANTEGIAALNTRLAADTEDHAARFDLAICEVARHEYPTAMEHLFQILEWQPDFRDGAAREMIVTLADMLSPNMPEMASEYRQRLANLLAS